MHSIRDWGTQAGRMSAVSFLVSFNICVQLTALGGNGSFLSVIAALCNIVVAVVIVAAIQPPTGFWRWAGPFFILLLLACGWALMPEIPWLWHVIKSVGWMPQASAYRRTDQGAVSFLGLAVMLVGAAMLGSRHGNRGQLLNGLLTMAAVNLAIGLLVRETDPNEIWGVQRPVGGDRFSGTLLNSNAAACLYGMLALLCLGQFMASASRQTRTSFLGSFQRILVAVLTLANFGACVVTGSRTALLFLVIGSGLLMWMSGAKRRMGRGMLSACIAAVAVLFFAGDIVIQRAASIEYDAQTRLVIWGRYWAISQQSPWFGFGLGSFSDVNLHFLQNAEEATMFWYINDAHNVFLRILLEGGWPYLLLLAAAFGYIFRLIFVERRAILSRSSDRAILVALAFALACGMVDIALSVPAIGTLCATLLGMLWGRAIRVKTDHAAAVRGVLNSP